MISLERILELSRFYLALFILVFGGLAIIESTFRPLALWESLAAIVVLVLVFGQALRSIGWEPTNWR